MNDQDPDPKTSEGPGSAGHNEPPKPLGEEVKDDEPKSIDDDRYVASLQFSTPKRQDDPGLLPWVIGVVIGILLALVSALTAHRPANLLVLPELPVNAIVTLLAGAAASAIPAWLTGTTWWRSLLLGLGGGLLCLAGVMLVFIILRPPPPSLILMRRSVGIEIVAVTAIATVSFKISRALSN